MAEKNTTHSPKYEEGKRISRGCPTREAERVLSLWQKPDSGMVQPKMIKLLHVMTVPKSLTFLSGQLRYMRKHGFEVAVLTSSGPSLKKFAEQEDVAAYAVEMPRRISPFQDLRAVWQIIKVIREMRPQIVHAHTPKGGLLGMIAAWLAGVSVRIYHMHGLVYETSTGFRRLLLIWTERISCLLAHRVICVSHSVQIEALKENICRSDKIVVLWNGSCNGFEADALFNPNLLQKDPSTVRKQLSIKENDVVIGFVGRIVRDKGIIDLVEAWSLLRDSIPNSHLVLVGEIESRDSVPDSILNQLESDNRIHMLGHVTDLTEMPVYYRSMDLLVLPTYREGLGNVLLEASAMGLPVVATRVTGCVDAVVDGVTGTLVPVNDPAQLAQEIRAYLVDPALRAKHGAAGRERVLRDFRPEDIWEAVHDTYINLLQQREL